MCGCADIGRKCREAAVLLGPLMEPPGWGRFGGHMPLTWKVGPNTLARPRRGRPQCCRVRT